MKTGTGTARDLLDTLGVIGYNLFVTSYRVKGAKMNRGKRLTVDVTDDMHKKVKAKAALEGKTVSDALRELLRQWLAGEVELPAQEGESQEQE